MMEKQPLLRVENLRTYFHTPEGVVKAVDDVSFTITEGEMVGLVGESGCGKTVTALSIIRLVGSPGRMEGGKIFFKGENLLEKSQAAMRAIRGKEIAMIWQDPMSALNPVQTVGDQIAEVVRAHETAEEGRGWLPWQKRQRREAIWQRVYAVMEEVQIPSPQVRARQYPHQLSGGLQQRVLIAMALITKPTLLIADEPTTALDVTIQVQILQFLKRLQAEKKMTILLITHNLGIVAKLCSRVIVMYAGKMVEQAETASFFRHPSHPYTQGLLQSIPRRETKRGALPMLLGTVPNLIQVPSGCAFHPRCPEALPLCKEEEPAEYAVGKTHRVKCHLYG
jgi:oligopeptide/dipeptide ABC transporter ATP-binding protein